MPRNKKCKKSPVWDYFVKKQDTNTVVCNFCKKCYKFCGNTSVMQQHLKSAHPLENCVTETNENNGNIEVPDGEESNSQDIAQKPGIRRKKQLCLKSSLIRKDEEINKDLIFLIAKDFQPLSLVEDTGFQRFVKALNSSYVLPSRKKVSEVLLSETYDEVKMMLKKSFQHVDYFAVTTDYWQSQSTKSFLSVTVHYIKDFKLMSSVLSTKEVVEAHTALNTSAALMGILNEWEIFDKITTIVTDNAANMKKAVIEELRKHHHPCVAHTINLTVTEAITSNKELSILLDKCRHLIGHFKHSVKSSNELRKYQKQLNAPELTLKNDVATRWNSVYIMIERLVTVKEALSLTLANLVSEKAPENLSGCEWATLSDLLLVLKPFLQLTEEFSGEKYITMSTIIPLIRGLQKTLRNIDVSTDIARELKYVLIETVTRRLSPLETNRIIANATFLDPRFKKIGFGLEDNAKNAQSWVTEEATRLIQLRQSEYSNRPTKENIEMELETVESNSTDKLWSFFDEKVSTCKHFSTSSTTAHIMVKQYLELDLMNRKQNPLEFWENHQKTFPELYLLAKKYLCVPATSVPSERLFSKAGYITNDRRSRLGAKRIDQLVFLNGNNF